MMIGGICESPLTIRALLHWRDQIADGVVPLRDIIDLEATYAKINGGAVDEEMINRMEDGIDDADLQDDDSENEDEGEEMEEEEEDPPTVTPIPTPRPATPIPEMTVMT